MPYSKTNSKACRGSVIILVVAVLVLLVVIGTVFIVSARSERNTSAAMSSAANLSLARDAVMNIVKQSIGNQMYDSAGVLAGTTHTAPQLAARSFDYPEVHGGVATANLDIPDEPWLSSKLNVQSANTDLCELTSKPFDPVNGTYNYASWVPFPNQIVSDTLSSAGSGDDDAPSANADAYINLLPYSDASGIRYRYGIRILDTSRMANLNTGATLDSLAMADTTGTNISSMRLAPTAAAETTYLNTDLVFFNSADVSTVKNLHATPTSGLGRAGLSTSNSAFTVPAWEAQILRMETPSDLTLAPYDLSDELELRSYGQFGTAYHTRPAASVTDVIWPNTLGSTSASRRNYTTISLSRDIRPYADPASGEKYALNPVSGTAPGGFTPTTIWPVQFAKVPVNFDIGVVAAATPAVQQDGMYYLAMIATNIATAMKFSTDATFTDTPASTAFSQYDIGAFVANYITMRWDGFQTDTGNTAATTNGVTAYYLPGGPSYVDPTGIAVCTANSSETAVNRFFGTGAATEVTAAPSQIYLGYAAQPFINQVAVIINVDSATHTATYKDSAVELFNPYNVALSLKGYHLKIDGADLTPSGLDNLYVPANGYLVVTTTTGKLDVNVPATAQKKDVSSFVFATGNKNVVLYRPYIDRTTGNPKLAAVDQFSLLTLLDPAALVEDGTDHVYTVERLNSATNAWAAAAQSASARVADPTNLKLGDINVAAGGTGLQLYDRYASAPTITPGSPFANIADFNKLLRICNVVDGTTGDPVNLIVDQISAIIAGAPASPAYAADTKLHFDFLAAPWFYTTAPATAIAAPAGSTTNPGDIRAVRLLDQIAFIDRVSDQTISIDGDAKSINKLRLPGQINLNTASGDVIRAIPGIAVGAAAAGIDPDVLVANIITYRERLKGGSITYNGKSSTASLDYSDHSTAASKYPGLGFRSLAEVLVPITDTFTSSPGTLDSRDIVWADIFNLCTVRSDTFVVYGYLEAVRQHPAYDQAANGVFDNSGMWYGTSNAQITDDPASGNRNIPLLRIAKRRFIAIIDRSYCNYSKFQSDGVTPNTQFTLPRILAIKDIPQ